MSTLAIQRVLALPGVIAPSTLYIVRSTDAALAELHFSNIDGTSVRRLINKADIQSMISASVGGASATAASLTTARTIAATGDVAWSVSFDGSANASAVLTLANTGVTAGEYIVTTVDAKGRVTSTRALTAADIPSLPGSKINSALTVDTSGNSGSATVLQTARTINGVSFNGSANITINAVDSTARIASAEKGAVNGVASLDATGKVPASQLPAYVDDVLEFANLAAFPGTGETGKIYVALDTNFIYRWSGSAYISITSGTGTSDSAVKLATARTIAATGDAAWSVSFDGSVNTTSALTLATSGVPAGEYVVTTVDAKGRTTAGRALVAADVPSLDFNKVTSAASVKMAVSEW